MGASAVEDSPQVRRIEMTHLRQRWGRVNVASALGASALAHALGLLALANGLVGVDVRRIRELELDNPRLGAPLTIEVSIPVPQQQAVPLPEVRPVESPLIVMRTEAHFGKHVFVERSTEEVMQDLPRRTTEKPPAATTSPVANPAPSWTPPQSSISPPPPPTTAHSLARQQRTVPFAPPAQAAVRQTAGASLRRPARLAGNRPPRYPETAKRRGWQGTVVLRLTVSSGGQITRVDVVSSSGYPLLDAEAGNAVRVWRVEPALDDAGRPVASEEVLPVVFQL